jgi:hypothetical protein
MEITIYEDAERMLELLKTKLGQTKSTTRSTGGLEFLLNPFSLPAPQKDPRDEAKEMAAEYGFQGEAQDMVAEYVVGFQGEADRLNQTTQDITQRMNQTKMRGVSGRVRSWGVRHSNTYRKRLLSSFGKKLTEELTPHHQATLQRIDNLYVETLAKLQIHYRGPSS